MQEHSISAIQVPKIAIVGATSHIARDYIDLAISEGYQLVLYARNLQSLAKYVENVSPSNIQIFEIREINNLWRMSDISVVLSFIGTSDPEKIKTFSPEYLSQIDKIDSVLVRQVNELDNIPYVFMSSGSVYDHDFKSPVSASTKTRKFDSHDSIYVQSKSLSENRHRLHSNTAIVDLRIFSYFSSTQNLQSKFLMSEIAWSILNNRVLQTSDQNIERDYIDQNDLFKLIDLIRCGPRENCAIDAYSLRSIDKFSLLETLREDFDLQFEFNNKINFTERVIYKTENYLARKFDYFPTLSSLDSIRLELSKIIHNSSNLNIS